jgi:CheY-like chemotaxis protein
LLTRLIGEHILLSTILEPDLNPVVADPAQMEQVLLNLIVNARDAMTEGGTLTIETANIHLDSETAQRLELTEPGSYVMLAVSDTGCGIDEETRERVFEPFFTTKEVGKGSGLGLSTVYGIVRQSNGSIELHSELEKGTTIKVYLPSPSPSQVSRDQSSAKGADLDGNETILLVEDEEMLRELSADILAMYGYNVIAAATGTEALELSGKENSTVDLLLTDVVMPGMSGKRLADELRSFIPGIKVLFMSGYADEIIAEHGILDEESSLINKPFTPEGLARKVREVLDRT